jgi:hypothetical protein
MGMLLVVIVRWDLSLKQAKRSSVLTQRSQQRQASGRLGARWQCER